MFSMPEDTEGLALKAFGWFLSIAIAILLPIMMWMDYVATTTELAKSVWHGALVGTLLTMAVVAVGFVNVWAYYLRKDL